MNKRVFKYIVVILLVFILFSLGSNDLFDESEYTSVIDVETSIFSNLAKFIEGIILWIVNFIVSLISNIIKFLFGST